MSVEKAVKEYMLLRACGRSRRQIVPRMPDWLKRAVLATYKRWRQAENGR